MTPTFECEDRALRDLSSLQPDAARAARTREQCRAILQRRTPDRRQARDVQRSSAGTGAWRNACAGVFAILCLAYVLSLIATTVSLRAAIP